LKGISGTCPGIARVSWVREAVSFKSRLLFFDFSVLPLFKSKTL
jgi:hypothetical protein